MSEHPLEISCHEVKSRLDDERSGLLLLDCRERHEHALVAIPQAVLLPMSELPRRIDELTEHRHRHIVVHCHLGARSLQVTEWMRQHGFAKVQSMAGGIDQWAAEIAPGMARY